MMDLLLLNRIRLRSEHILRRKLLDLTTGSQDILKEPEKACYEPTN